MNKTISSMRRISDTLHPAYDSPRNSSSISILNSMRSCTDTVNTRPPVDMIQRDRKFLVSVELPGIRQEDISLETSGRSLIVKGKYREKKPRSGDAVFLEERKRTDVYRFIYMPMNADLEKLETARYKDGVLHIQVPEISLSSRDSRTIQVRGD